MFRLFVTEK